MITLTFSCKGLIEDTIEFPEKWNDLTAEELQAISKVWLSDLDDIQAAKSIMLLELLKYRAKLNRIPLFIVRKLDPEQLSIDGLSLVDFVYNTNELTTQPYPTLKVRKSLFTRQLMQGPASDFDTLTVGEYEAAEIHYLQFAQKPEVHHLASIAAILFRPPDTDYYRFDPATNKYHTYEYEKQVAYFSRLHPSKLFTIYLWYTGCRSMLPKFFKTIYEGDDGKSQQPGDLMIFTKCIHSAAGPKNGTRDQIRTTLLKALFFEMELEAIKAKEQKALYDNK